MDKLKGLILSIVLGGLSFFIGQQYPLVGGPVLAMVSGIIIALFINEMTPLKPGLTFATKKILQGGVVLLGFGLNLSIIVTLGVVSFPTIVVAVATGVISAFLLNKLFKLTWTQASLIGMGSCICGGSAVMALAPVVDATEDEVATAISVVFLFNLLAALLFVPLGSLVGMSTTSGFSFGLFSGSAVNDTSSVTATASLWDSYYQLGTETLDTAVTVKLIRTLFIIPVVFILSTVKTRQDGKKVSIKKSLPTFILFFLLASLFTTILSSFTDLSAFISLTKTLSRLLITIAMAAVGLSTDLKRLLRKGLKPILLGGLTWCSVIIMVLLTQYLSGLL